MVSLKMFSSAVIVFCCAIVAIHCSALPETPKLKPSERMLNLTGPRVGEKRMNKLPECGYISHGYRIDGTKLGSANPLTKSDACQAMCIADPNCKAFGVYFLTCQKYSAVQSVIDLGELRETEMASMGIKCVAACGMWIPNFTVIGHPLGEDHSSHTIKKDQCEQLCLENDECHAAVSYIQRKLKGMEVADHITCHLLASMANYYPLDQDRNLNEITTYIKC